MDGATTFVWDKEKKKILFVKRRDVPIWVLPGGGIEKNESPEDAAIRETFEESGFRIKIVRKIALYTHIGSNKHNHIYEGAVVSGKATLSSESKEVSFFDIDKFPELRHPLISDWFDDLNKNSEAVIERHIQGVTNKQVLGQFWKHPILVIRFFLTKIGIRINT